MMSNGVRDLAAFYRSWGHAVFIAVAARDKRPLREHWQSVTYEQSLADEYQQSLRESGNMGVLHGPPSDDLVAVDCDSDMSVRLWLEANPWSVNTRQARGKKGRRFYFRMKGSYPARRVPFGNGMGEWHGGNTQTVIDGIHPDGPRFTVLNPATPIMECEFNRFAWPGIFRRPEIETDGEQPVFTIPENVSLDDFLDIAIPPETNLIGNRWLTRDGSLFIVGLSGHGKSSLAIAIMIHWSIGRIAFGLKPARPLKIMLIEAEDDIADNKEFVQVIRTLDLNASERQLLKANTRLIFRQDLAGDTFFKALDQYLDQFSADIIIVNPLSGFYTQSLSDDQAIAEFLRIKLAPLMARHHCAPIIIAHMPKKELAVLEDKQWYEWMYVLTGGSAWTNWARAILVISPTKERGTYRFISAKRHAKTGWTEPEFYFSHDESQIQINGECFNVIQWVASNADQISAATPKAKKRKREYSATEVHQRMSPIQEYSRDQFRTWCKEAFDMGIEASDRIRRTLIDDGLIDVIETQGKRGSKAWIFKKNDSSASASC